MQVKNLKDWNDMDMACNACGVAQSMAQDFKEFPTNGTHERNRHPVARAYLLKLCDLAGIDIALTEYSRHYDEIKKYFEETNENVVEVVPANQKGNINESL